MFRSIKCTSFLRKRSLPPGSILILAAGLVPALERPVYAMHISEGILPGSWAGVWFAVAAPFVWLGVRQIKRMARQSPKSKPFLALVGAAVFVISCMPIPVPVVGSCSHPCGTGLASIMVGPFATVVLAAMALLFQALFLAHGGLTTLGANILTMGIAGGFTGYVAFRLAKKIGLPGSVAAFLAGVISDWATYGMTAFVLAVSLYGSTDFFKMFVAILLAFVPTQLPLGLLEGVLTAGAYRFVEARSPDLLGTAYSPETL